MIAVDTSTMIAFFEGGEGEDIELLKQCIESEAIVLPPLVLSEIVSDPELPSKVLNVLLELPLLEIKEGYWQRAGELRAKILKKKLKARMADSLITQSCLGHDVPLITRDSDFRHFAQHVGLKLLNKIW